jgi:lambda family phage portal protein
MLSAEVRLSEYRIPLPNSGSVTVKENVLDRVIRYIDPIRGANRLRSRMFGAIAGSYTGASRTKKSLKEWHPLASDADTALTYELDTLRARSRDLIRNAPLATGAVNTAVTNVVGTGLKLNSRLDRSILNITDERADELEKVIEAEWSLFWDSTESDIEQKLNGDDLGELAFRQVLENGDVFVNLRHIDRGATPYQLRVQLVEADRLCNPQQGPDTEKLVQGVEKDENGAAVAYHVASGFPVYSVRASQGLDWTRVPALNAGTGLPNAFLLFRTLRPGQTRGIPYLAPVIDSLKQLDRYSDAEITAAVISSFLTVFVKTESGTNPFAPAGVPGSMGASSNAASRELKLGPGAVAELGMNESIETVNPGRPNAAFDPFVQAILRQIGVALEIPFEILIKHFTASYSAARAALLEAWKFFSSRRAWLASHFYQEIYAVWFYESVALGRIPAPGFFLNPLIRKAYLGAECIGPARGMINEKEEVTAASLRIDNFLSTHATETALLGGDWEKNLPQLRKEAAQLNDAGLKWPQPQNPQAAPEPPKPPDEGGPDR